MTVTLSDVTESLADLQRALQADGADLVVEEVHSDIARVRLLIRIVQSAVHDVQPVVAVEAAPRLLGRWSQPVTEQIERLADALRIAHHHRQIPVTRRTAWQGHSRWPAASATP